MGIFGWSLPPGCTQRHIDEAYGDTEASAAEDAFRDAMWERLASIDDDGRDAICKFAWQQISEAYAKGYRQGQDDSRLAADLVEEDKLAQEYWRGK